MAVYRQGMRGEEIKTIQEKLSSLGIYTGAIDGIYGPLTAGAVLEYQAMNGLTRDGIAGPQTLGHMGLGHLGSSSVSPPSSPSSPGPAYGPGDSPYYSSGPGAAPGYDPQAMIDALGGGDEDDPMTTRFVGVAGTPKLWKNATTGRYFLVYYVPNVDPKIPMMYEIPGNKEQVEARLKILNPDGDDPLKPDNTYSQTQINNFGGIEFGTIDRLPRAGHPFTEFSYQMDKMKETMPWLADPEVLAIYANAAAIGRPVEPWELEMTDWYQSRTEGERDWLWLQMRDPSTAQQVTDDNEIKLYDAFREEGIVEPPQGLVEFMAHKLTTGQWTQAYLNDQLLEVTGITTGSGLDTELSTFMDQRDIETLRTKDFWTYVRDQYDQWLGPGFAPDNAQIRTWADKMRTNADVASDELTEYLRRQRLALFPEYTDDSLTYDDIAEPWRNFTTAAWGQRMDETDPLFSTILKMNDATEASKLLRKEGLERGVPQVQREATAALFGAAGGQVRPVI